MKIIGKTLNYHGEFVPIYLCECGYRTFDSDSCVDCRVAYYKDISEGWA